MAVLANQDIAPKTPAESVFVTFQVGPYLNDGATVSSVTWTTPGLTNASPSTTTTACTSQISGGVDGQDYLVTATVSTSDGETLEFAGRLRVRAASQPR